MRRKNNINEDYLQRLARLARLNLNLPIFESKLFKSGLNISMNPSGKKKKKGNLFDRLRFRINFYNKGNPFNT